MSGYGAARPPAGVHKGEAIGRGTSITPAVGTIAERFPFEAEQGKLAKKRPYTTALDLLGPQGDPRVSGRNGRVKVDCLH